MTNAQDARLLAHAALDGELDAAGSLDFERRLAEDPALAAEFSHLRALREAMARHIGKPVAPEALRARVKAMAAAPVITLRQAPRPSPRERAQWRAIAASAILAAGIGSGATWMALAPGAPPEGVAEMLVADHMRGLLSGQPVDVASSDRHTVKPWFNARLALAPQVVDLAAQGFTLIGGRVDVIGGGGAPTLVYRHKEHLISLTALPAKASPVQAIAGKFDGYSVLSWRDGGAIYWAISDIDPAELATFRGLFEAAVKGG